MGLDPVAPPSNELLVCDKCRQPVPANNDAVRLDVIAKGAPLRLLYTQARHLLPVPGCPGSPSRAQYLPGQPPDTRYPYLLLEWEQRWRDAYAQLQREHPAPCESCGAPQGECDLACQQRRETWGD